MFRAERKRNNNNNNNNNNNVKVKFFLCFLIEHHAMKAYWGVEVYLHAFLTSALDGGEWSASCPGRFTPRENARGTHLIGCWVGPRSGLDVAVKREIPSLYRDSNTRSSSAYPSAVPLSYSGSCVPVRKDFKYSASVH
jgi:hypothetical protein